MLTFRYNYAEQSMQVQPLYHSVTAVLTTTIVTRRQPVCVFARLVLLHVRRCAAQYKNTTCEVLLYQVPSLTAVKQYLVPGRYQVQ